MRPDRPGPTALRCAIGNVDAQMVRHSALASRSRSMPSQPACVARGGSRPRRSRASRRSLPPFPTGASSTRPAAADTVAHEACPVDDDRARRLHLAELDPVGLADGRTRPHRRRVCQRRPSFLGRRIPDEFPFGSRPGVPEIAALNRGRSRKTQL